MNRKNQELIDTSNITATFNCLNYEQEKPRTDRHPDGNLCGVKATRKKSGKGGQA